MCGIFGYIGNNKQAADLVLTGLKSLEYRGYDSWGIAAVNEGGRILLEKKTGKIGAAEFNFKNHSRIAIGHTRWATHGGVTVANAHPHLDCTGHFALIHNGIIENYDEIKKALLKIGHRFISETDSEVAVHLLEENYKSLIKKNKTNSQDSLFVEALKITFSSFRGLNAVIVLNAKNRTFGAAKNGSPLVLGFGNKENYLASDSQAILPYTNKLYFMEDQELVLVTKDQIKVFDLISGKEKSIKPVSVSWKTETEDKGKLPHFMLKEILDQGKVIKNIVTDSDENIKKFASLISSSFGTYLVGCGTAAYACLTGTYIFSKIAKKHVNFSVASEFGYLIDFLTEKSLVIGLSQSGETIDLIDVMKKAKERGVKLGAIVNVLGSTLYRMTDNKLLLNAGVEKAVVSTKAFTAKIAHLLLIAYALTGDINKGKTELRKAVEILEELFKPSSLNAIKTLATKLYRHKNIYIIGRGISYPIALESALKIKEASYIHAEGFAGGELKHGVIALVEKGTPCLAFLPNDETYFDTLSGVMEMKARGGFIIGIGFKNHEVFDEFINSGDCQMASGIPNAVVGQLLGYYLALCHGVDPDKPRNLAKSVTVK